MEDKKKQSKEDVFSILGVNQSQPEETKPKKQKLSDNASTDEILGVYKGDPNEVLVDEKKIVNEETGEEETELEIVKKPEEDPDDPLRLLKKQIDVYDNVTSQVYGVARNITNYVKESSSLGNATSNFFVDKVNNYMAEKYGSLEKAKESDSWLKFFVQTEDEKNVLNEAVQIDQELLGTAVEHFETLRALNDPQIETDFVGDMAKGDYGKAIYGLIYDTAGNIPQRVTQGFILAQTGNPWLASSFMGVNVAGGKGFEIDQKMKGKEYSEGKKLAVMHLHGAIELTASRFLGIPVLERMISTSGYSQTRKAVQRGMTDFIRDYLSAYGLNFAEEFTVSAGQQATDYIFGLAPELAPDTFWKNNWNAGFVGGAMGLFTQVGADVKSYTTTDAGEMGSIKSNNLNFITEKPNMENEVAKKVLKDIQEEADAKYDEELTKFTQEVSDALDFGAEDVDFDKLKDIVDFTHKQAVESNFGDINILALLNTQTEDNTLGIPELSEDAKNDLTKLNIKLDNDISTDKGKIEASIKYLKLMNEKYELDGDDLVAGFVADPILVRRMEAGEIEVEEWEEKTGEPIREYHKSLAKLKGLDYDSDTDSVVLKEKINVKKKADPNRSSKYIKLSDNQVVSDALKALGYEVGNTEPNTLDEVTLEALQEFNKIHNADSKSGIRVDKKTELTITNKLQDKILKALKNEPSEEAQELYEMIRQSENQDDILDDLINEEKMENWKEVPFWEQVELVTEARRNAGLQDTINLEDDLRVMKESLEETSEFLIKYKGELEAEQINYLVNLNKPTNQDTIINTTKILRNPQVLNVFKIMSDIHMKNNKDYTNVKSHEYLKTMAEEFFKGNTIDDIVEQVGFAKSEAKRLAKALETAPESVFIIRQVSVATATELMKMGKKLSQGSRQTSALDWIRFINMNELLSSITGDLATIHRRAGQVFVASNIEVDGEMVNIEDLNDEHFAKNPELLGDLEQIIEEYGGRKKLLKIAKEYASGDMTPADIAKKSRNPKNSGFWRAVVEYRSANLFRHVGTYKRNISGQFINTTNEIVTNHTETIMNMRKKQKDLGDDPSVASLNQDKLMTNKEAFRRTVGTVVGVKNAVFNPITVTKQIASILENGTSEGVTTFEAWSMLFKDPSKFEDILSQTQMGSPLAKEQLTRKSISSDLIPNITDDTKIGAFANKSLDNLGALLRLSSFAMIEASDRPFAYEAYYSELAGQLSMLEETNTTKSLEDRKAFISEVNEVAQAYRMTKMADRAIRKATVDLMTNEDMDYDEAYNQIVNNVTNNVIANASDEVKAIARQVDSKAIEHSQEMTWKDPFDKDTFYKTIENTVNKHSLGRILVPIVHTPLKMVEKIHKRSGVHTDTFTDLRGENGERAKTRAQAQFVVTWSTLIAFTVLAHKGIITPPARDSKEREVMEQAGVQPASVIPGDKSISYTQFGPTGHLMNVSSSLYREIDELLYEENAEEKIGEAVGRAMVAVMLGLSEQTALTQIQDTLGAFTGQNSANYFKNLKDSMSPIYTAKKNWEDYSYLGLNPLYEPVYEDKKTGGMKRDMYGEPIMKYDSFMGNRMTEETDSPIRGQVYDLNLSLPKFKKRLTIKGISVELTDEEYQEALRYLNEEVKIEEKMNDVVRGSVYQRNKNADYRETVIRKEWARFMKEAEASILKDPDFIKRLRENREKDIKEKEEGGFYYRNKFTPDARVREPVDDLVNILKKAWGF